MTEQEQADMVRVLTIVDMRLRVMEHHHPDGSPKTPEEIKREVWDWLRLVAARPTGQAH